MRVFRIVMTSFALALVVGACSSNETSEPTGGGTDTTTEPAGGAVTVTIVDFEFQPADVTPGSDGVLRVVNEGSTTHTFTMDDGSIDEELAPGDSVEVVVGLEGGGFHCEIHASMTGTVLPT